MGVTYKLTDDVVQFILKEKHSHPNFSCRELSEKVQQQFQRELSKSAVHEVLKEANIISPRGRKGGSKFQIPKEKKAQLFAGLSLLESSPKIMPVIVEAPVVDELPVVIASPVIRVTEQPLKPLQEQLGEYKLKDFLLQAAMFDLFPKPWRGLNHVDEFKVLEIIELQQEIVYRQTPVISFQIELEDGCIFYIENGFLPIERALKEIANCFINNLQPIVIKEFIKETLDARFYDFLKAMQADKGKGVIKIALIGSKNEQIVDFKGRTSFKRNFILSLSPQVSDIKQFIDNLSNSPNLVTTYFQKEPIKYFARNLVLAGHSLHGIIILDEFNKPNFVVLSNMPVTISDGELIRMYMQRYPLVIAPFPNPCLPAGRLPVDRQGINAKDSADIFKEHILKYFHDADLTRNWDMWGNEPVKISSNEELINISVVVADTYSNYDKIVHGLSLINAQAMRNYAGQQIFFQTSA